MKFKVTTRIEGLNNDEVISQFPGGLTEPGETSLREADEDRTKQINYKNYD